MVIDSKLLEIRDRAEAGDPNAQYQLVKAYVYGSGVSINDKKPLLRYAKMLAYQEPHDISEIEYATLLSLVADILYYEMEDYYEASRWYRAALAYINQEYSHKLGKKLIKNLRLLECIDLATLKNLEKMKACCQTNNIGKNP